MIDLRAHHPWIDYPGPFPAAQPRVRLFCFPPAGVGASAFRAWQSEVLDGIPVCGVQLPGRGDRFAEPPFTRLEPLVDRHRQSYPPAARLACCVFRPLQSVRCVAFELARRLRDDGQEPIHLMVSALPAPPLLAQTPPLHRLPTEEFIAALVDLNGIPDDVLANRNLVDMMLPTLRADFEVCETYDYRPGRPLGCRSPPTADGAILAAPRIWWPRGRPTPRASSRPVSSRGTISSSTARGRPSRAPSQSTCSGPCSRERTSASA